MYNKATLIGYVGKDPQTLETKNGDIAKFSLATSTYWKDKSTGEKKQHTEWHSIVVTNPGLVKLVQNYVKKSDKLFIEGRIQTRKYEKEGQTHHISEIILTGYENKILIINNKEKQEPNHNIPPNNLNDDNIPF